ncbi:hypothetical protein LZ31DRAFT_555133 [Colletotrichum somersetense]|nr:hypothetical protein LZ31DRAFT_555133 [Colletotrichum somersetense]
MRGGQKGSFSLSLSLFANPNGLLVTPLTTRELAKKVMLYAPAHLNVVEILAQRDGGGENNGLTPRLVITPFLVAMFLLSIVIV